MRRFAIVASLLAIGGIVVLFSSQHRLRLVVTPFHEAQAESLNWDTSTLHRLPERFPMVTDSGSTFVSSVALLARLSEEHPTPMLDAMPIIDDPDTCFATLLRGASLHCYNVDLAVSTYLAKQGVYSRLWDMNGSRGLGRNGHNLLEVLDTRTMHWHALDPYYHCYFTRMGDSDALSFADLRKQFLSNASSIVCHWYAPVPYGRTESSVKEEFALLAPFSSVHANNDFRWRYDHRYGLLMPMASLLDGLPLRATRAIRTVMLGDQDARFIIMDARTPKYPFVLSHALFYTLSMAAFFSILLLLVTIWKSFRMRVALKRATHFHLAANS